MHITSLSAVPGYESVHRFEETALGLVAFIARHDSVLGTPLGGCRLRDDYRNESEALADVLRLAEGMTHKAAVHDLPLGGGKMVVWSRRPLGEIERGPLFRFVGRAVESLGGGYITAEDMNTTVDDMRMVREITPHAAGITSGDPSEFTALGVWESLCYLAEQHLGKTIVDCRLAVQGAGKVGAFLVREAARCGVSDVVISDIVEQRAERLALHTGYRVAKPETIYRMACDIFVPCGAGGILSPANIERLDCRAVAGAANNQLDCAERDEALLRKKGIRYCPDVVVNGGGLINVACEFPAYERSRAERLVRRIPDTLDRVLGLADRIGFTATSAVHQISAERRRNAAAGRSSGERRDLDLSRKIFLPTTME